MRPAVSTRLASPVRPAGRPPTGRSCLLRLRGTGFAVPAMLRSIVAALTSAKEEVEVAPILPREVKEQPAAVNVQDPDPDVR